MTALVTALGIDSIYVHIMLAGLLEIIVSFGSGVSVGLLLRDVRQVV